MSTVYKVVRRRQDGKLASAVMRRRSLAVIYEPGKEARSLNGMKLLALDNKQYAHWFAEGNGAEGELEIWEAETPLSFQCPWLATDWTWKGVKKWWASSRGPRDYSMCAPPGTVACDSITLIKRVDGAG